jgi:hypothetical protein
LLDYEYNLAKKSVAITGGSSQTTSTELKDRYNAKKAAGTSFGSQISTIKSTTKPVKSTPKTTSLPSIERYAAKTKDAALLTLKVHGLSEKTAKAELARAMNLDDWSRRKNSGSTAPEVKNYKSYEAYLTDYVKHSLGKYGKLK